MTASASKQRHNDNERSNKNARDVQQFLEEGLRRMWAEDDWSRGTLDQKELASPS